MPAKIHPTAIIEAGVAIGDGTAVWDNVHIRADATIGEQCIIGGKTVIAYSVKIGNRVKINSFVYLCHGVTLEDGVMVGAHVAFTNDQLPRATTPDLGTLRSSAPDESTRTTLVREGASIGAGCVIGSDLTIGRFAMVGMGSLVTRSAPDFHLVYGRPARSMGCVCRCGEILKRFSVGGPDSCAAPPLTPPRRTGEGDLSSLAADSCGAPDPSSLAAECSAAPPLAPPRRTGEGDLVVCSGCGRGYLIDGETVSEQDSLPESEGRR